MYMNSAYLNNSHVPFIDKKNPLTIASCGTYQLKSRQDLPTLRPKGRIDYQMIYIATGKAYFYFDNDEDISVVTAGNLVLYRPKEMQKYIYYGEDKTEVYWIHFTGYEVKSILDRYGFSIDGRVYYVGHSQTYINLFEQLIKELQRCQVYYVDMLSLLFQNMLILFQRYMRGESNCDKRFPAEIEKACQYFRDNYQEKINIDDYAKSMHFSPSWFIKTFKKHVGIPPMHYLTKIRLANAQTLLENTMYSVTQIANIVGYDNPLYFSRIFRQYFSMSPSQYRKIKVVSYQ